MLAVPGKARFRLQHLTPRDAEVIGEIIRDQLEAAALTDQPPARTVRAGMLGQHYTCHTKPHDVVLRP